jgi:hypothetical protein
MIFIILIIILVLLAFKKRMHEGFVPTYPQTNCVISIFGNKVCYPPYKDPYWDDDFRYKKLHHGHGQIDIVDNHTALNYY